MVIFPAGNLVVQEFEKIKKLTEAACIGQPARNMVNEVFFSTDYLEVEFMLNQTKEFKKIIENGEPFPVDGFSDVTKELQFLTILNSIFTADSFLNILFFLRGMQNIFSFFEKRNMLYPIFGKQCGAMFFDKQLIYKIEEVIDDTAHVKSSASPDLSRIRRVLVKKRNETARLYQSIMQKFKKNGWVAETEESVRNGRRVISILAEQKRTIGGIVHDISATGKTVFIEPEATIAMNNELYDLEQEEKREILRILKALTNAIRPACGILKQYSSFMNLCDFTRAKALFAITTASAMPILVKHAVIDLKNARHPLLFIYNKSSKKVTIPFSLRLDKNRILVISGPNAGGKTVCMKTIGLAQLMLQSGFLVPADANSIMGIFDKIFVDLGDSQSLEYELSTYSSRLVYMKTFIEESNNKTLFLIDEFGTGTDPNLGGALAEAILEELNRKGPFGIITTHYLNLKLLAERTPGIINGSMAFSPEELKPLYRLIIGKPGSSYTFVVAERSGLPKSVIQAASQKIDRKTYELEKLLTKVESDKNILQEKLKEVVANENKINVLIKKYDAQLAETQKIKFSFENKLKEKEARLIEDMNRMFIGFMKEWKTTKSKKQLIERFSKQLEIKYSKIIPDKTPVHKQEKTKYDNSYFKPGTIVTLAGGKTRGKIESLDGNKAKVLFGDFYTYCSINDLIPLDQT